MNLKLKLKEDTIANNSAKKLERLDYLSLELPDNRKYKLSERKYFNIKCNFFDLGFNHYFHTKEHKHLNTVVDSIINLGVKLEKKEKKFTEEFNQFKKV